MSTTVNLLLLLPLLLILVTAILTTTASAHPSFPPLHHSHSQILHTYPPPIFAIILSAVTANANLSLTTPTTIFAATDSSLLTCPSCSLSLHLQKHSLPGLYTLHFLHNLAFATTIETFAPNPCLTITASPVNPSDAITSRKVFVNGVQITKPDLFNNGHVIVHGIQGLPLISLQLLALLRK